MPGGDQSAVAEAMRYLASRLNPDVAKTIEGARTVTGDPAPSGATIRPLSRLERLQKYLGDAVEPIANQPVMQAMAALGDIFDQGLRGNLRELPGAKTGAIVYHGSPHRFDKFDMSKIGTGEGAQVYGHGLYFAENPGVAKSYRDTLTMNQLGGTREQAAMVFDELARPGTIQGKVPMGPNQTLVSREQLAEDFVSGRRNIFDFPPAIQKRVEEAIRSKGSLYKVDLPDDQIAKMLDWDAPLSQQAPEVQQALASLMGPENMHLVPKKLSGQDLYATIRNIMEERGVPLNQLAVKTSEELNRAGVPGIKYFDQGSRASAGGELIDVSRAADGWRAKIRVAGRSQWANPGTDTAWTISKPYATEAEARAWADSKIKGGTRNYVAFRDDIVKILERDGAKIGSDMPFKPTAANTNYYKGVFYFTRENAESAASAYGGAIEKTKRGFVVKLPDGSALGPKHPKIADSK